MKRNELLKKMVSLLLFVIFMATMQILPAKADSSLDNPTTVYGFLDTVQKNYGGELYTMTYYGDYEMYISDYGIGATTYYLSVGGRKEKFFELLEDGIQSIQFVTTKDALLNDPEGEMMDLIKTMVVQAEENLFSEEGTLALE